jgi:hypothetical protein
MAKLPLYRGDVAGLVYDVTTHGVPGRMRGFVADIGYGTDLFPLLIDNQWCESAITVTYCHRGKEEGG